MKNNNAMTSWPPTTNLGATTNLRGATDMLTTPERPSTTGASNAETMQVFILLVKNPK